MNTVVAIIQPGYLPWLGFFDLIRLCDVLVLYDTAQYVKHDFYNRNRIRSGVEWQWLTVPVHAGGFPSINSVIIDNSKPWMRKQLGAISLAYSKAPYFGSYWAELESLLLGEWSRLVELQIALIGAINCWLDISPRVVRMSELPVKSNDRNGKLVEICQMFNACSYLSSETARFYLDVSLFEAAGIEVLWKSWKGFAYPQVGEGFMPQMSAIDLLFNCGGSSASYLRTAPRQYDNVRSPLLISAESEGNPF